MENKDRQNLNLTGDGTAAGGVYNNVKIVGEETINGDIDCINFKLVGTCDFEGNLKTKTSKLTGTLDINGNLEAEEIKVTGTINVKNDAFVKELTIRGETVIRGNASIEKADIFGYLHVNGECNAESFISKGPLKIGGLLNAGTIDVALYSKCQVKEIGGERINIRRGRGFFIKKIVNSIYMPSDYYRGQLISDNVEGDDIYLEYTKAKVVRGNNIEIGPGCEIELVEYKDSFKQHKTSSVADKKAMG